jgi:hypothetical protein
MDGYAVKVDRRTGKIVYLVRLGGNELDTANRVLLDRRGFAYFVGFSGSQDFPISADAIQKTYGGGDSDAFLSVIDPNGSLVYSTYLGGRNRQIFQLSAASNFTCAVLPMRSSQACKMTSCPSGSAPF